MRTMKGFVQGLGIAVMACGVFSGCASPTYLTPTGYLGLADDAQYPEEGSVLVADVAAAGYYAVSETENVAWEEYLAAKAAGRARYEAEAGNAVYYCVETDLDLAPAPNVREWVRVLERKKAARP